MIKWTIIGHLYYMTSFLLGTISCYSFSAWFPLHDVQSVKDYIILWPPQIYRVLHKKIIWLCGLHKYTGCSTQRLYNYVASSNIQGTPHKLFHSLNPKFSTIGGGLSGRLQRKALLVDFDMLELSSSVQTLQNDIS